MGSTSLQLGETSKATTTTEKTQRSAKKLRVMSSKDSTRDSVKVGSKKSSRGSPARAGGVWGQPNQTGSFEQFNHKGVPIVAPHGSKTATLKGSSGRVIAVKSTNLRSASKLKYSQSTRGTVKGSRSGVSGSKADSGIGEVDCDCV